jgi:hypothetical protein
MSDTIDSLRRQISEAEENLRLIQEPKSEYVLATDAGQTRVEQSVLSS